MRKTFERAAFAAIAIAAASLAQATPIDIQFTGTVRQASATTPVGTAVAGGFHLETDRFVSTGAPLSGVQYSFIDWQPSGLTQPLAYLSFSGADHELPLYPDNYAMINFADGCQPVCNPGSSENFNIGVFSEQPRQAGYTGQLRSTSILLYNLYETPLPDFPYFETYNAFDGAAQSPDDILSLPLSHLDGAYIEGVLDCVEGVCSQLSYDYFVFDIGSLTRGVAPTGVPEPGALGLMALAFSALFLFRRRAPAR